MCKITRRTSKGNYGWKAADTGCRSWPIDDLNEGSRLISALSVMPLAHIFVGRMETAA
jgi:hypothetical protein